MIFDMFVGQTGLSKGDFESMRDIKRVEKQTAEDVELTQALVAFLEEISGGVADCDAIVSVVSPVVVVSLE